jgi:hypothetical protein
MRLRGNQRCLKFRIGANGNVAYEALLSDPFCEVTKEHIYNSYEEVFLLVWFIDFGQEKFDPNKYLPKRSKKKDVEEQDGNAKEPGPDK